MSEIKLSEAMREGAKLRPQIRRDYFGYNDNQVLCSCALGAVWEYATGKSSPPSMARDVLIKFGIDNYVIISTPYPVENPMALIKPRTLDEMIVALNDKELWTREQIADWLESIGY